MPAAALLRAILSDPDDPAPYLVYADHLLSRGDPRGELIHLQLRLESLADDDPAAAPLEARLTELLAPRCTPWHERSASCSFRRGFLDLLHAPASLLLAHVTAASADDLEELGSLSELSHLRDLVLGFNPPLPPGVDPDAALATIFAALDLRRVEDLGLLIPGLGPRSGATVARAALPRLRSLRIDRTGLYDAGVTALVDAAPELPSLESLSLTQSHLTDDAALALARWPHLARLRRLDLSSLNRFDDFYNAIGDRGAIALVSSLHAPGLAHLWLGHNAGISSETAFALASSPHLTHLTELGLSFTSLDDRGAEALATSPSLAQLTTLDIGATQVTDAGLAALLRLPSLSTLYLYGTPLTVDGLRALVSAPPHLTEVHIGIGGLDIPADLQDALIRRFDPNVDLY